ncbi:Cd(II)/Pb(II)-responsive transcriptional regulator [Aquabacterium parvum]|jgi:Cd(II)/Pb(II)-responsive transcriptional regulator|uniref:Cd(II)/Pb(II)-responsive transcriptional regulator n=1 Tax=Aquabacterium parvum TaxID=70584 RepID=UPI000718CB72|nr:Cd(II)/Pb(II)-responsive transcriptional regulator [Aquabacterium parvum]
MKIGELAERAGVQVETIRFYEREGLLQAAARSAGNYRIYESLHVQRLAFIRHCRSLDMTLDEVRVLLRLTDSPDKSCAEVNQILDAHIGQVSQRIKELRLLELELKQLRSQCRQGTDAKDCAILSEISRKAPGGKPHRNGKVGQQESARQPG